LAKLDAFTRGAIEVQDEGSQLLALLLDAKRGEMVVDFCAGAGGKTLAIGATMRNTGRLYAFDTSAHRLDALKPRWPAAACPMCTRPPLRMSATTASSAWPARSTACWWTRLARAWARCAATRPEMAPVAQAVEELVAKQAAILQARRACSSRAGGWSMPPAACCRRKRGHCRGVSPQPTGLQAADGGPNCWKRS
jgi:hypothetical protein